MNNLPKLVTFDGQARSGKGTRARVTKDYLRDECGYKVMLIDAGQVFRVLVLAAQRAGVDIDEPASIDQFLGDEFQAEIAVRLVKSVYHMPKEERDALLYTAEVGANSAKIGARPLAQDFKDSLLRKWLRDARQEGYDIVLLDGRALEETGAMLEREGLCDFVLGLYFVCDPVIGAQRTLDLDDRPYEQLATDERAAVDDFVAQIAERNRKDRLRDVQPNTPPFNAPTWRLPDPVPDIPEDRPRPMLIIDTSARLGKAAMTQPVAELVAAMID